VMKVPPSLVVRPAVSKELRVHPTRSAARRRRTRSARKHNKKKPRRPFIRSGMVCWVKVASVDHSVGTTAEWSAPQAALVAIDPTTRLVLALVGSRNFHAGDFDRAVAAKRQPGSAFKPILYATALASRRFTAASVLPDTPEVFKLWKPRNSHHHQFLGPVRLRVALARSINTVAIKLISQLGPESVRALARRLGIRSKLTKDLSLALGSSGLSPLELTNAYATFDASGVYEEPRFILRIGKTGTEDRRERSQVLDPGISYVLTSMLTSVIREGTGRRALRLRRPAAGKTGTTNRSRDTWFVGYTPELVAGVWVGFDDFHRSPGGGESGARTALPIWLSFMKKALAGRPVHTFAQPASVVVRRIDPVTGLRAPAAMANGLSEVFVSGTEPKKVAPMQQDVAPSDVLLNDGQ